MSYWLRVWTAPRLLLTPLDEMAMAAECIVVLLVVVTLYAIVRRAVERGGDEGMDTDSVKVIDVLSQERDDEHLARSRAEDECGHLRAEVDRLRALAGRQQEALRLLGILRTIDPGSDHDEYEEVDAELYAAEKVAASADGKYVAEEFGSLLRLAEAAQAWEDRRKAYVFGAQEVMEAEAWLCVALDGLRAVRDGKEEQDGHGPCEAD